MTDVEADRSRSHGSEPETSLDWRTMETLRMFDLMGKRILVARGSARAIQSNLAAALSEGDGQVALDFFGIDGLASSFLDEILSVVEDCIQDTSHNQFRITVINSPTQLSSKFTAVGRGHGLSIRESGSGTWIISKSN